MNKQLKLWMLAGVIASSFLQLSAQKKAVSSAEYLLSSNTPESILEAKGEIDKAALHETTKDHPHMWFVRSMVYSRVFSKKGNEMLAPVSEKSGYIAGYSMMQFWKSPTKNRDDEEMAADYETANSFSATFNESGALFEKKDYNSLLEYYKIILFLYDKLDTGTSNYLELQKINKKTLTETLASIAVNSKDDAVRVEVLQELVDAGSTLPAVYEGLSNIYMSKGDTAKAESIIRTGLAKSNNDDAMFQVLINHFVSRNRVDLLFADVNKQIELSPGSKLYYTRGYLYEINGDIDNAMLDYRKAIELDEFNYDANFNLGLALLKYESNKLYDQKVKANAEGKKKIEEQLKSLFKEARGYLEMASQNKDYSVQDQLNIYKALKTAALELDDKEGAAGYDDMIKALEASAAE